MPLIQTSSVPSYNIHLAQMGSEPFGSNTLPLTGFAHADVLTLTFPLQHILGSGWPTHCRAELLKTNIPPHWMQAGGHLSCL
jgi:hypothetical protein